MRRLSNHRSQPGFSLIETLVALVVLSIGLLGIAALQVEGLKSGQTALLRTKALFVASDMIDRIRANPDGGDAYVVGTGPVGQPDTRCADDHTGPAAGDCTAAEMAAYDIWLWKDSLAAGGLLGLPDGTGEIERNTEPNPPAYQITIRWTEKRQPHSYNTIFQDDPRG